MTRLPWLLWAVILGWFAVAAGLGGSAVDDGVGQFIAYTLFIFAFTTVGALVASRRPRNPIGWVLMLSGLGYAVAGLTGSYAENELVRADPGPGSTAAAWVSAWMWMLAIAPAATFGLLLFPDGRLPSPRWRKVAWLAAAALGAIVVGIAVAPGRLEGFPIDNPLGVDALGDAPDLVAGAAGIGLIVAVAGSVASVVARFRRAGGVERQQLKWLTLAALALAGGVAGSVGVELAVGSSASALSNAIVTLSLAAIPIAMGIGILRHRLFDIDLVIRRTLVYGALTATLAAGYLGCVLVAQLVVSPQSDLAIAASTLAVAALFRPARARIQGAVDRRFYRRRYDAARTLEDFGGRLREEVELDALASELRSAVRETVQPAHLSLWLRRPT
jgi:hypothetical protein